MPCITAPVSASINRRVVTRRLCHRCHTSPLTKRLDLHLAHARPPFPDLVEQFLVRAHHPEPRRRWKQKLRLLDLPKKLAHLIGMRRHVVDQHNAVLRQKRTPIVVVGFDRFVGVGPVDVEQVDLPIPASGNMREWADDEVDVFGVVEADGVGDVGKGSVEGEAFFGIAALFEPVDAEDVAFVFVGEGNSR